MRQFSPIQQPAPTTQWAPICVIAPTCASSPITAKGPMLAPGAIFASGATTAVGCTPFAITEASHSSAAAFANASFASFARNTGLPVTVNPAGKITHLAADASAPAAHFAESTKIKSLEEARSGAATPLSSTDPSPSSTAPITSAKSFAVYFIAPPRPTLRNNSPKHSSQEIVERRLAFWPRFPTRVYPHPLFRIFSNNLLGHLREKLGIF